jgi:putative membrane-bound dehydrogenase-like protein
MRRGRSVRGLWVACVTSPAIACVIASAIAVGATPEVVDPRYVLEPFAADPDIVTPTGCTHDAQGRLLVIESHTHHRPEGYIGPAHDRIRLVEDTDGDGRADRFRTFFEGTKATMGLRRGPAGAEAWIYVATRSAVFRIRDTDGDDVADDVEDLLTLDTTGDYPHNGLGSMAFDAAGRLVIGLGENLGVPYELRAVDGSSWSGEGEGGAIFRCSADGKSLERIATGFWNPFGLGIDPHGRLFTVDNDPDGRPPCRLIDVVPTGDYGYAFRYGRSGRHPLQAWDGELPGTLPMAAGTGEAPCNVVPFDGALWVTSWGHNRLEVFQPRPDGAACRASSMIPIQGDQEFRPVDMAIAPDGSLFFTDWVDRSYPVHGRGRIWRLRVKEGKPRTGTDGFAPLSAGEQRARLLAGLDEQGRPETAPAVAFLRAGLHDTDPFVRQGAVAGMVATGAAALPAFADCDEPRERESALLVRRWLDDMSRHGRAPEDRPCGAVVPGGREALLAEALADNDDGVRLLAIRWIADEKIAALRPALQRLLADHTTSPRIMPSLLSALDWLDQGKVDREASQRRLQAIWQDPDRPAAVRLAALRMLPQAPAEADLGALVALALARSQPPLDEPALEGLAREAVRLLTTSPAAEARGAVARIAADASLPGSRRADALVGLAHLPDAASRLGAAVSDPEPIVAATARRLAATAPQAPGDRPVAADLAAWEARLEAPGDADAGWRIFFGSRLARCGACHAHAGRGAAIGPDLAGIVTRMGRRRVLESILQPAKEVGPMFQPYTLHLADGRGVTGLPVGLTDGDKRERILAADGTETIVELATVEHRVPLATSIMPAGLEAGLSDADLRDLLAFLSE